MNKDLQGHMSDAKSRSETYARLAQVFRYPEEGVVGVLTGAEYIDAFDRAVSKQACSLRGHTYMSDVHPTAVYEELLRFYQFFGLARAADALLPDHLVVELEFMQFLCGLEHQATARGESIQALMRAQRDFLQRHLSVIARGMRANLHSDSSACQAVVELCNEIIDSDLQRLQEAVGVEAA